MPDSCVSHLNALYQAAVSLQVFGATLPGRPLRDVPDDLLAISHMALLDVIVLLEREDCARRADAKPRAA